VLISQIMIVGLFALSLDLILGYAGIVSLGHAAFFGLGAYTAGPAVGARLGRTAQRPAGRARWWPACSASSSASWWCAART
jgi:ABC-type branched-subunit amino acid transport system permease subunit